MTINLPFDARDWPLLKEVPAFDKSDLEAFSLDIRDDEGHALFVTAEPCSHCLTDGYPVT